ncbi:MAG TPA: hypothetical protein DDY13_03955 [Cytophagales bacterium]|jgi:hypothetical protein|nr:hypothetical protein [Cytophagales bacterium]
MENNIKASVLAKIVYKLFDLAKKERNFFIIVASIGILCFIVYPYPQLAMWVGFMLAGYSAIANDSIQTIGTFIASNSHRKWYHLWIFMGLIWVATVTYSYIMYDGDVTYQRLATKGFQNSPEFFSFGQVASPLILLILTRLRMPVSTSILLLSVFSTKASSIGSILEKSFTGYFIAFGTAFIVWYITTKALNKNIENKPPAKWWVPLQWITSGALWSVWIMQDAANIAVYLPRSLNVWQFIFFSSYIFFGLGLLFYLKGDKIQGIVNEKSKVTDVRSATIIDFVYACILYYLKVVSTIPISTTWVFIGLLGGREIAYQIRTQIGDGKKASLKYAARIIGKDALYALIGLIVSLILAVSINEKMREQFLKMFE